MINDYVNGIRFLILMANWSVFAGIPEKGMCYSYSNIKWGIVKLNPFEYFKNNSKKYNFYDIIIYLKFVKSLPIEI